MRIRTLPKFLLSLILAIGLMYSASIQMACSKPSATQVENDLQKIVTEAQTILGQLSNASPIFAKVKKFADDAAALLTAYRNLADPNSCIDVATAAAALTDAFTSVIVPLFVLNPAVAAAVTGIDLALNFVVSNFHNCVTAALAKTSLRMTLGAGRVGALQTADAVFVRFLALPKL